MLSAAALLRPAAPSKLTMTGASATRIDLAWRDNSRNETAFLVYGRPAAAGRFALLGKVSANIRKFGATGLLAQTAYQFCVRATNKSGGSAFSAKASAITTSSAAAKEPISPNTATVTYSNPIVITAGGVYSGNWQSLDPNVPAVTVNTSAPVIIQNSNIRSRGTLIDASGGVNLTVQNTNGYGMNPNKKGRYAGRFLKVDGFDNILVTNNYMEGTSGIYLYGYEGNHTAAQSIHVIGNRASNIDGRYSDGKGGYMTGPDDNYYVQFFQTNSVHNIVGAEVAWNEVINLPGQSRVEDNISIFDATGTPSSPFVIHDNYIQGAYPVDPAHDTSYTGGGIMLSDQGSAYIQAYNNQVLDTINYGIAISSGHDNIFYNNRIVSAGVLTDGTRPTAQNVGAYIWNQNKETTFTRNQGSNNLIGWVQGSGRNDSWTPDASAWKNNTSWGGTITQDTLAAEYALWVSKLANAGVQIGPA